MDLTHLLSTLALMFGSLALGYTYRLYVGRRHPARLESLKGLATALQRTSIIAITPLVLINTFWGLRLGGGTLVLFPFIGAASHVIGGIAALLIARRMGLGRRQTGSMFTSGAFTNLGSFGSLVAFMFYGEAGYALAVLFRLLEPLLYYSVGFPMAKLFADETPAGTRFSIDLRALAHDVLILLPILSIAAGTALRWSGLSRPELLGGLISPLILLSTAMMLTSVGLNMRPAALRDNMREAGAVAAIKFIVLPLSLAAIGFALGYHRIDGGLPFRVLVTLSAMPVAFNALIPPSLYRLDMDLANSAWILTTGMLVLVLPLLYFIKLI